MHDLVQRLNGETQRSKMMASSRWNVTAAPSKRNSHREWQLLHEQAMHDGLWKCLHEILPVSDARGQMQPATGAAEDVQGKRARGGTAGPAATPETVRSASSDSQQWSSGALVSWRGHFLGLLGCFSQTSGASGSGWSCLRVQPSGLAGGETICG
jgi:hypothetical protein